MFYLSPSAIYPYAYTIPDDIPYTSWPELDTLLEGWRRLVGDNDHLLSGVLADYLDDHRPHLLADARLDAEGRLSHFINHLRHRCTQVGA